MKRCRLQITFRRKVCNEFPWKLVDAAIVSVSQIEYFPNFHMTFLRLLHAPPPQIRVRNPLSIASPIIQLVSITFHSILLRFRFGHSSMKSIYEMNFASHKILYITQPASQRLSSGLRERVEFQKFEFRLN